MPPSSTSKITQNTLGQHKGQKEKKTINMKYFLEKCYIWTVHIIFNYLKFRFSRMHNFILPLSIISEGKEKN